MTVDDARFNSAAAIPALETLWPDAATREAVADCFATSIAFAHSLSPACWSLTLFSNALCLNVGQIQVLDARANLVVMYAQGPCAPHPPAGVALLDDPSGQFYSAVSVPCYRARIDATQFSSAVAVFRAAHNQIILSAAALKRVSPFKSSHSPAVLDAFRQLLGRAVPDPDWFDNHRDSPSSAAQPLDVDDDLDMFGDPTTNPEVEQAAVQYVTDVYRERGWTVVSVERKRCGYDLRCIKGPQERHVEVKGCSGDGDHFIITAKEHAAAFSDPLFRAAVVAYALQESKQLTEFTGKQLQSSFEYRPMQFRATRIDLG